jgi:myo-inositol-1(or 4)-monophosphatase
MSPKKLNNLLVPALKIAKQAGEIALTWFEQRASLTIESKGHHDWVSEADRLVEHYIRDALNHTFPDHHLLGEETGGEFELPCWVVDPIDGTTNFLYGQADFVVSMALIDQHGPAIGIIYAPAHNRLFYAIRGMGAYEQKLDHDVALQPRVSAKEQLVIGLNLNYQPKIAKQYLDHTQWLIQHGQQIRVSGSAAWTLTQVANGELDGCYLGNVNIWDAMAAQLICEQAGLEISAYLMESRSGPVWAWPKGSPLSQWIQNSSLKQE